jgi:hypothetical protein
MPPEAPGRDRFALQHFVEAGVDADFGKPKPLYKIAKPPFYAAWATPVIHDTRAGLRINAHCQVLDSAGRSSRAFIAAASRRAASACTVCRAPSVRA